MFAGQQAINNAKPIFSQLVSDLTNHVGDAVPLVQNAVAQLTQVLAGSGKRDVVDFLLNSFGLGQVWNQVQQAGAGLVSQFQAVLTQLLFAGQQVINNAKPIFAQLVSDLTNHVGDAVPLVQNAVAQLNQVLSGSIGGKRDVVDFLLNSFGLGQVWSTIQQSGNNLVAQFQAVLTQLLFAGQQAINNAKPIFSQLVSDLTNHIGDAVPLVQNAVAQLTQVLAGSGKRDVVDFLLNSFGLGQVWSTIQSVGGNLLSQFTGVLTQLMFAGGQAWNLAKPIFDQLKNQLLSNPTEAAKYIAQALTLLNQVLAAGKRSNSN